MIELEDLWDADRPQSRYLEAVEGKTASLFEFAARLGAELSSAPWDDRDCYSATSPGSSSS